MFVFVSGSESIDFTGDLTGLKIAATPAVVSDYEAKFGPQGFFAVSIQFVETYTALQTGVIDGALFPSSMLDQLIASFAGDFDLIERRPNGVFYELSFGTFQSETIFGSAARDDIEGRGGDDKLIGRAGADELLGQSGNDILRGGGQKDFLSGGGGKDKLFGGNGADELSGGKARDTLTGGKGADTFVFLPAHDGTDKITDFEAGVDSIQIIGATESDITLSYRNGNTFISVNGDNIVKIDGQILDLSDLNIDFV